MTVRKVLVGPAADIVKEFYLAAVLDRAERGILLMGSAEGGVEIEQVAADATRGDHPAPRRPAPRPARLPGARARLRDGPRRAPQGGRRDRQGPRRDDARVRRRPRRDQPAGDRPRAGRRTARPSSGSSASTPRSRSTTPRSPAIPGSRTLRDPDEEEPDDREAREAGLTFIKLDGTIGCMVNGAGLAMTTMDLVKRAGGEPANFLDIGGGARADKVAARDAADPGRPEGRRDPRQHLRRHHPRRRGRARPDRGTRPADARRPDGRPHRRHQRRRGRPRSSRRRSSRPPPSLDEAAAKAVAASRGSGRHEHPRRAATPGSLVQGITGREGEFHARAMQAYGTARRRRA